MPPKEIDPQSGGFTNEGFEFQMRYKITGRLRLKRLTLVGRDLPEKAFGDTSGFQCATPAATDCQTGCLEIECPGYCSAAPDFNYRIN